MTNESKNKMYLTAAFYRISRFDDYSPLHIICYYLEVYYENTMNIAFPVTFKFEELHFNLHSSIRNDGY